MDREVRAAIRRQRRREHEESCRVIARQDGQMSFARGLSLDDNPRRSQPLRAEWARGWHEAESQAEAHAETAEPTAANRAAMATELMKIRQILER